MKQQRHIVTAAAAVIVLLTAGAFALSYAHLHDVAAAHGLSEAWRAWAWPGCLDAFIVAGELLMLRAALRRTVDWWAIGLTIAGSGGSIALNVAGVAAAASALDHIVAAVPPSASLLAFGALMRQVHEYLAASQPEAADAPAAEAAAAQPVAAEEPQPAAQPVQPQGLVLDFRPSRKPNPMAQPIPAPAAPAAPARPQPRPAAASSGAADDAALVARARKLSTAAGRPPSLRALQTHLGVGQRRAQRIQAALAAAS